MGKKSTVREEELSFEVSVGKITSGVQVRGPRRSGELGRGEAQELRRGAAAQADASSPAPDPGGANIYPATVAKQGGRRREASS